jgi:formate hydrogenlyase subunit 3/multisubunit Na+/H+ antiporter MnhD subunit
VLSLVGFPGTLGFIQEEIMLGEGLEHHAVLIGVIAVALTLNVFSGFRLFARIFYPRNGLAPSFLVNSLTSLGHSMPEM